MKKESLNIYVCPYTQNRFILTEDVRQEVHHIQNGVLCTEAGETYDIQDGIPIFMRSKSLSMAEEKAKAEYDAIAIEKYDNWIDWLFTSFYEDEDRVRDEMVSLLDMKPDIKVLEVGCGTGRDSVRIGRRLNRNGQLFVQDISGNMVRVARNRLESEKANGTLNCFIDYFISTANFLPFSDDYFDGVYSFGSINEFENKEKALLEFSRICKPGGSIVIGDEGVAPWLKGSEYEEIIATNNPIFRHEMVSLAILPKCARKVQVRWVLGNCFYLIKFVKGDGTPALNLDLPHKGFRGGTLRTRYYGRLEGVTLEAKELAYQAAKKRGLSLHQWLDEVVKKSAVKHV
jgi:ubiquinone/menaquinone biosynthesis C-methylase UbiE